jgi:hypothetical protein
MHSVDYAVVDHPVMRLWKKMTRWKKTTLFLVLQIMESMVTNGHSLLLGTLCRNVDADDDDDADDSNLKRQILPNHKKKKNCKEEKPTRG